MSSKSRESNRNHKVGVAPAHDGCSKCNCPILIVEDQKSIASFIDAYIKDQFEYDTIVTHSFQEAEQAIKDHTIHLSISDLNLPDAPYGEIVDLLTKNNIATIALTGAYGHDMKETILKKGAIDYIPKQSVHSIEYAVGMANRIYENHHTNVLVVDDALSSRAVLKHILEKLQFNVITAESGKEALEILSARKDIRLALVDYEMPVMNGCELIHEIRKQFSKEHLAIIGISASDTGEMSAQFLKSGANDFVRKPYSYEEILCRVGQNLEVLDLIRNNWEAAYRDYLTGLHNRRYFFQEGADQYKRAKKHGGAIVAMIDVDHFKKVNDTFGHDCGDEVLKALGDLLIKHFGKYLVARLGGEEFAVFLHNTTLENARPLFEAFRLDVENNKTKFGEKHIPFTISIGITDNLGETIGDFIKAADNNLYQAKEGGRNKIVISTGIDHAQ